MDIITASSRRKAASAFAAALSALLFLGSCASARSVSAGTDTHEAWLGDVKLALRELPKRHKDLYALMPKDEYRRRSSELLAYAADPARSRDEMTLALSALVASIGDGHTLVRVGPETTLPLSLYKFEEGYVALAVPAGRPDLLGARVVSVCGRPMEEVEAIVAAVVSRDNDMALAGQVAYRAVMPFFLSGLGIAERDAASYPVGFELTDGTRSVVDIAPVRVEEANDSVIMYRPSAAGVLAPLAPVGATYWFARVPGADLLYLAYDSCREDPARPLEAFAADLAAELDSGGYRAVLVDLRRNGGGASNLFWPVERVIAERSVAAAGPGGLRVYAAIGRRTFSSAVLNAIELRFGRTWAGIPAAGAVYVGEPSGGKPNHYGEVVTLELPALRATLCYSTKLFTAWPGLDDDALYPELAVPQRYADIAAGRDAVLEAVLFEM